MQEKRNNDNDSLIRDLTAQVEKLNLKFGAVMAENNMLKERVKEIEENIIHPNLEDVTEETKSCTSAMDSVKASP